MRVFSWVALAVLSVGVVGCGEESTDTGPSASGAQARVAATVPGRPLDGGVPVARSAAVSPQATLTAFPASSMLRVGSTTYATGVGWLGAYRGTGLVLGAKDGALRFTLGTDGQISDAVPDGRGGAFVGGEFTRSGGLRRAAVVHVGPGGAPDRRFVMRGLRFVNALAVGGGRLYVGGSLDGDEGRRGLVAVSARTGRVLRGFRAPRTGRISELELRGGRLYAGGALPEPRYVTDQNGRPVVDANGVPRETSDPVALPVAALDPATGRADPTFRPPRVLPGVRGQVTALRVVDGRLWVAAGSPGSAEQTTLRVLRPSDGHLVATPRVRGAFSEVVADGSRAIVVGGLTRTGGGRDLAQAFDARTGRRRPSFAVRATGTGDVAADAVVQGGRLVLGGAGGPARTPNPSDRGPVPPPGFVVRARLRDGALDRGFRAPTPDHDVQALARVQNGLLVGGKFAAVNVRRTDLAAFDATTGRPSGAPVPKVPGARDATLADGKVWTTDGFSLIAFDPATGKVVLRVAVPFHGGEASDGHGTYPTAARVRLTAAGGRVFLFGGSGKAAGTDRGIAAYDATTAERVAFRLPLRSAENAPTPTLLGVGDTLYVGGSFKRRRPSGQQADLAVMKLDPETGALDETFDAHVDGPVSALGAEGPGKPLFLAGYFRASLSSKRPGTVLAVDPATGTRDRSIAAAPARADDDALLSVTPDRTVLRPYEGTLIGVAFSHTGEHVPVDVRGARWVSTTDGAQLTAAGAPGLLGFHTPAEYGLIQRHPTAP